MTETNEKRQTGYIYSIRSYHTELIYIGSTFGTLRQRLYSHKYDFKRFNLQKYHYVSSYEIVKYDDAFIELVEKYENVNKMELHRFEGQHIRQNKCVNKVIAGQTHKEYYFNNQEKLQPKYKMYRENNKDKRKQYYEANIDKLQAKFKFYRENNKDKMQKYDKNYYETNKEKINEHKKKKYVCVCAKSLTIGCKARHDKVCKGVK